MKRGSIRCRDFSSGVVFSLAGGGILWLLSALVYVLPSEEAIDILRAVPNGWLMAGVLMSSGLLFLATGTMILLCKWHALTQPMTSLSRIVGGALLLTPSVVFGILAPRVMGAYPLSRIPFGWAGGGLVFLLGILLLAAGGRGLYKQSYQRQGPISRALATTMLLTGLILAPFALSVPAVKREGLRLDGSPYLIYPEIRSAGERISVRVELSPFDIQASADSTIERLDEHTLRLKSKSSRLSIRLMPGEAIYGLTERVTSWI